METPKIQANIVFSQQIDTELEKIVKLHSFKKIFILTETKLYKHYIHINNSFISKYNIVIISIEGGEKNKTIETCIKIWKELSEKGVDRKSLLINIGGGLITDLGGFVASVFKRGIKFINIPTTLLAQVDASIGGKTGVNFEGLKNEIGTFNNPEMVLINTLFIKTLDKENFLSGFAEMIKHGLINSKKHLEELRKYNINNHDYKYLEELIADSNKIKEWYVENDFKEDGIRKALNFGHTVGHALESYAMLKNKQMLHGYAVAHGMIIELYISNKTCNFPQEELKEITGWILKKYGKIEIHKNDHQRIIELMKHDKKNESGEINFTLLKNIGEVSVNIKCNEDIIKEAISYYSEL